MSLSTERRLLAEDRTGSQATGGLTSCVRFARPWPLLVPFHGQPAAQAGELPSRCFDDLAAPRFVTLVLFIGDSLHSAEQEREAVDASLHDLHEPVVAGAAESRIGGG